MPEEKENLDVSLTGVSLQRKAPGFESHPLHHCILPRLIFPSRALYPSRGLELAKIFAFPQQQKPLNRATKTVAWTLGALVGLAGIEHGFFEVMQGSVAPSDILIDAIGSAQRFWVYGGETALTLVPNFFITGVLAIVFGLLVVIWASKGINRKYGAAVLMVLSISLWLVGGGFAPIFMAILATVAAAGINNPWNWWRAHFPVSVRNFLAKLWPWSLISFVVVFAIGVEIAIFGYPLLWFFNTDVTLAIQSVSALVMVVLMIISVVAAFAFDIKKSPENIRQ